MSQLTAPTESVELAATGTLCQKGSDRPSRVAPNSAPQRAITTAAWNLRVGPARRFHFVTEVNINTEVGRSGGALRSPLLAIIPLYISIVRCMPSGTSTGRFPDGKGLTQQSQRCKEKVGKKLQPAQNATPHDWQGRLSNTRFLICEHRTTSICLLWRRRRCHTEV